MLRYNELRKLVPEATPKMLTQQLRELETDGLIVREVYPIVPPKVEYSLTERDMAKILVGLSGGVDSAVALYLLKKEGHDVTAAFMRNWDSAMNNDYSGNPTINNEICPQEEDYHDAQKVSDALGVKLIRLDYVKEYWENVFSIFLSEYKKGRTPNPDILCNKHIKFDAFLNYAMEHGFDYIATGHYVGKTKIGNVEVLKKAGDKNKDQSYFLAQLTTKQIEKSIFPLDRIDKKEVREIASELKLVIAQKKDSTGICFIGERDFRKFLTNYLPLKPGDIVDIKSREVIGEHKGSAYYTIGQRKGLGIGGISGRDNSSWFVVDKNIDKNIVFVADTSELDYLYADEVEINDINLLIDIPSEGLHCSAKFRYRQADEDVFIKVENKQIFVKCARKVRAITAGQQAHYELYRYYGEYKNHPRYGQQFEVVKYERINPTDKEAIIRFLSSSQFPGIGKIAAEEVYNCFGEESLNLIQQDATLLDTTSLNEKQKKAIIEGLQSTTYLEEAVKMFVQHGLTLRELMKMEAVYKGEMIQKVLSDPYALIDDIDGIDFKAADKLALSLGLSPTCKERIEAAIKTATYSTCQSKGDTYTNKRSIYYYFNRLIGDIDISYFESGFDALVDKCMLIVADNKIYPAAYYNAEVGICEMIMPFVQRQFDDYSEATFIEQLQKQGYNDLDIQVIAPMYLGVCGIDNLNAHLREIFNPQDGTLKELKIINRLYREKDKIIQLKNQPLDDVYNGDIGIIKEIIKKENSLEKKDLIIAEFEDNIVVYDINTFKNITHAYAISVHKAQGSEYPIVIMPITSEHEIMLKRKLIYTGITRAKKILNVIGSFSLFEEGIARKEQKPQIKHLEENMSYFQLTTDYIRNLQREWASYYARLVRAINQVVDASLSDIKYEATEDIKYERYTEATVMTWWRDSDKFVYDWRDKVLQEIREKNGKVERLIDEFARKKFYNTDINTNYYLKPYEEKIEILETDDGLIRASVDSMTWSGYYGKHSFKEDFSPPEIEFTDWIEE
ncbi:trna 5-methylaminomethyl-2-thiouridylate -methyltransferase [Holotrichia oblita]|nr:trna 5-methylaminomethyl-2-thiouridylate -methyltransferase [Holotrichia oblita]